MEIRALTPFQRRALWLLGQGHTPTTASACMGCSRSTFNEAVRNACVNMRASTSAQAVLRAYLAGQTGLREDCGTRSAYVRHMDAGEDACPRCRLANDAWLKRQSAPLIPLTEADVRLLKSLYAGRSLREIEDAWNISASTMQRAVRGLYERLGVTDDVPVPERRLKAYELGIERGVLTPVKPPYKRPSRARSGARSRLAPSEIRVLRAAAGGQSLQQVALRLNLRRTDVSSTLSRAYRKLDLTHLPVQDRRTEAVRRARAQGLLE